MSNFQNIADMQRDPKIAQFCGQVGAADLPTWLDLSDPWTSRDVLAALDKKRRYLERHLQDTACAAQMELLEASWEHVRDALLQVCNVPSEDPYGALNVSRGASFTLIRDAWQKLQDAGHATQTQREAWKILGDPVNRAQYDKCWRPDPDDVSAADFAIPIIKASSSTLDIEGPDTHTIDLLLDPIDRSFGLRVRGEPWVGQVYSDHDAMKVMGPRHVQLKAGKHHLRLRFNPRALDGRSATGTLSLHGQDGTHILTFRLRRADKAATRYRRFTMVVGGATLVVGAFVFGSTTHVSQPEPHPSSVGTISQVPTVASCILTPSSPRPDWIDIHTDGLGRPSGFSIHGLATPEAEICVRTALTKLVFPPTNDGLPAFHRYRLQGAADTKVSTP